MLIQKPRVLRPPASILSIFLVSPILLVFASPVLPGPPRWAVRGGIPDGLGPQGVPSHLPTPQESHAGLRVMTFNIRYGSAADGPNAWPLRRDLVADLIRRQSPDVLAIQEGLHFQLEELENVLAPYRKLGQHREGGTAGEFSGLYVRDSRVRILRWGEFWLSSTSQVPASVGWDAALPRMAVWADLEMQASGDTVRIYGTHFDHRGAEARRESARLILEHAQDGPPTVVMGDLNATEDSAPVRVFMDAEFVSAYTALHPTDSTGTFNGFQDPSGGERIDHILLGPRLRPARAEIVGDPVEGVWPSDHFAVVAIVRRDDLEEADGNLRPSRGSNTTTTDPRR